MKGEATIDDDRHRFEALWSEHFDVVFRYARRRADEDGARDAAAETFTTAWRRRGDIPEEALPWLLGVCRRVLANQRRGDGRRRQLMSRLAGLAPEAFPDTAEQTAESEHVRAAFARLRRRDREALALVAWDGLTPAEAAATLGCSPGALANRLHRARARLARELARHDGASMTDAPTLEDSR